MKFLNLSARIRSAFLEDHVLSDITTKLIPGNSKEVIEFKLLSKGTGIYCGAFLLGPIFKKVDPRIRIKSFSKDGQKVKKGQLLAKIKGSRKSILGAERVFLNLACHLSGISTLTHRFVQVLKGSGIEILDTRKTTPLWRDLEKYAVLKGGGKNHRFSLGDAVLIKDNHLKAIRKKGLIPSDVLIPQLKKTAKGRKFVELEAQDNRDVWEGIKIRADVIMLDNMSEKQIKEAIIFIKAARRALNSKKPFVEVSGGINLKNIRHMAKLGVDRISIGALTHSAPALDLSMEVN